MASAAAPCRRDSGTRTLIAADAENGTIAVAVAATEAYILGGFLAAMLFDTVGPAELKWDPGMRASD
jgi:hypothetical protein